tara:strand:- start:355 stop:1050 length:696 start_codon:yes stop_codon:yes gene_type:complete
MSGGTGKFAQQILKHNNNYDIIAPSHSEMDISNIGELEKYFVENSPDIFLHTAAMTRPMVRHIVDPSLSIQTNIIGTSNVALMCIKYGAKLVYLSTDYVYPGTSGEYKEEDPVKPFNEYAWSKLGGECAAQLCKDALILRMSMSDKPFPHRKAFVDVKKNMIYNDAAAKLVLRLLDSKGVVNVGGEPRYIYDFVKEHNPNIDKISLKDINDVKVAPNPYMNIDKMKRLLNE